MNSESLDNIKSLMAAGEDIESVLRQNMHFIRQAANKNQPEVRDFLLKLLYEQKPENHSSIVELFSSLSLFKDPLLIPEMLSFTKRGNTYAYDLILFLLEFDTEDLKPFSEEIVLYLSELLNDDVPYANLVLEVIAKLNPRKTIGLIIDNGYLHHNYRQIQRAAIGIFIKAVKKSNQSELLNYVIDFLMHSDPVVRWITALNLKKCYPSLFKHLNLITFVNDLPKSKNLENLN
ncbi:MAG TPA: hypothetical protein VLL52_11450 [Anaerolineae bacterium]|nr:hypothetical protein [Anaerolineae bacterium]